MGKQRSRSLRRAEADTRVRGVRLEELLREELNFILQNEAGDARLEGVRVTFIELSRDGARARVWYAHSGEPSAAELKQRQTAFEEAQGFLRARLYEALPLKRSPQLSFRWDPRGEAAASGET